MSSSKYKNGKASEFSDMDPTSSVAQIESLMEGTIERVQEIDRKLDEWEAKIMMIPETKVLLNSLVNNSTTQSAAAVAMSTSYTSFVQDFHSFVESYRSETQRFSRESLRFDDIHKQSMRIDQVPLKSHNAIVRSSLIITVAVFAMFLIYAVSDTKSVFEGSIRGLLLKIGQQEQKFEEVKQVVREKGAATLEGQEQIKDTLQKVVPELTPEAHHRK